MAFSEGMKVARTIRNIDRRSVDGASSLYRRTGQTGHVRRRSHALGYDWDTGRPRTEVGVCCRPPSSSHRVCHGHGCRATSATNGPFASHETSVSSTRQTLGGWPAQRELLHGNTPVNTQVETRHTREAGS